jgi:hypothetical protein
MEWRSPATVELCLASTGTVAYCAILMPYLNGLLGNFAGDVLENGMGEIEYCSMPGLAYLSCGKR